ncbi:MAG: DUF1343 domain-containing protein [Catalinimonas sp.]
MKMPLLFACLILVSCATAEEQRTDATSVEQEDKVEEAPPPVPVVGAARLEAYLPLLTDRRVGLVVNHTSLIEPDLHLVDVLRNRGVEVVRIFTPEHGFRGTAADGEHVKSGVDAATGLPIVSLYGRSREMTDEHLAGVDVVVFDLQDVGTRFYTYISTMHYVMAACARLGKLMVVLDRPNPNGSFVDGPIREEAHRSFVGMHPIPILHGMTVGELAQMINGEGWLGEGLEAPLQVVEVENYTRDTPYAPLVPPSPNLPNYRAVRLYPTLCLLEGTTLSVGRGTPFPFQAVGGPSSDYGMFTFTPVSTPGASPHPPLEGQQCWGVDYRDSDLVGLSLQPLLTFWQNSPDKENFFRDYIHLLAGTARLKKQIEEGYTEEEIRATWAEGLARFRAQRLPYLLYE